MKTETLIYRNRSWDVPSFPDLDSERTLVLAFGTPGCEQDPRPLLELASAYPKAQMVGCSTAGEIFGPDIADGSVVAAVCRFDSTRVTTASARLDSSADSRQAGLKIAHQLRAPDLRAILLLSDGLGVNASELLRGLREPLGNQVVVTGGLSADSDRFRRTWTIREKRPESGWVTAVGLSGQHVDVRYGSRGGWEPFGLERSVTRSEGNVLFDIDGQPALDLYKQYLGELVEGLPGTALLFPLGLSPTRPGAELVVRTVLSVDEDRRSMTFAGDIPQGSHVQLMRTSLDRLVDGARSAAEQIRDKAPATQGGLAIAVSCIGRRLLMGEGTADEVEAVARSLPAECKLVGFYSYGEITPAADGGPDVQNQTMTLTHINER